jgi:hypothetical protein
VDRDKLHLLSPGFRAEVCHCPAVTRDICGQQRPDAHVHAPGGPMRLPDGAWLIKDATGDFWAVDPVFFAATYEPAEGQP